MRAETLHSQKTWENMKNTSTVALRDQVAFVTVGGRI
jgi:hypothetical protein